MRCVSTRKPRETRNEYVKALAVNNQLTDHGITFVRHRPFGSVAPQAIARLPGRTLGVALDGNNTSYWCDITRPAIYAVNTASEVTEISRGAPDAPFVVPNYPAFLHNGHLLVSESGDYGQNKGMLQVILPDGTTHVLSTAASNFTNGLCVSGDSRT
jgi:hypothetical protein